MFVMNKMNEKTRSIKKNCINEILDLLSDFIVCELDRQ